MTKTDIIRSWRDEDFCADLGDTAVASPAGPGELSEAALEQVTGGGNQWSGTAFWSVCWNGSNQQQCP